MTNIEQSKLKELESEKGIMNTMNTNTPNKFLMNYNPYISQKSNSWRTLQKRGALMKDYIKWCWIKTLD